MPEILDLSKAPDKVKQAFRDRGLNPDDTLILDDPATGRTEIKSKAAQGGISGLLKTAGFDFAEGIGPTAAGLATAAGATALAAPTTPLGQAAVAVPSAVAGGVAAQMAQRSLLEKFAPDYVTEQEIRRRSNPIAATVGQTLSGSLFGLGYRGLFNAVRNLGAKEGAKQAVKMAAFPVALGGALEAGSQLASEGEVSLPRVGVAALGNLGQVDNTKLGTAAENIGKKLAGKIGAKTAANVPVPVDVNTIDPSVTAAKVMDAFRSGQLVEGGPLHQQLLLENNLDPGTSVDTMVKIASNLEKATINNKPELRAELAGKLFDALQAGQDPAVLAESKIETLIKDLYKSGDIKTRAEAVRIAKAPDAAEELNILKRERAENAGPPPLKPGQRMTDEQVDILLKATERPPNASKLDDAVLEGKKEGFVNSAQDIRFLEDAYIVNPDSLPNAMRTLWEEKQLLAQGPTAADAADAFQRRETQFFAKDFPKLTKELELETAGLGKIEAIINDKNASETTKALNRSKLESARKSLDEKWQRLLDKALEKYPTGKITEAYPVIDVEPLPDPFPVAPAVPQIEAPPVRGLLGAGEPGPIRGPEGPQSFTLGQPPVLPNPAAKVSTELPPDVKYSGLPPRIAREMGKMLAKVLDIAPRFIREGKIGNTQVWSGTKSTMDRIRALGPAGEAIRVADDKMNRDALRMLNTATRLYSEAYAGLNPQSTAKVNRYLNDMQIAGSSFVQLSPSEQAAVNKIRRGLLYLANQGVIRGGPGVAEGALFREMKIDPNYIPTIVDKKIRQLMKEGGAETAKYKADWISWYQNKLGKSAEEAEKMMNDYLANTGSPNPLSAAEYAAVTQAEGVGLPPSWRADPQKALMYHAFRASKNYAWFTHVQKDPVVAKALGVTDDGWGGKIDTSNVPGDSVGNTDAVQAWLAEQNLHMNQDEDMLQKLTRIATSLQLGPLTGLRDLLATPAHLAELIPGEDMGLIGKALKNVLTSDTRGDMEKQGLIRNKNLQPFEFLRAGGSSETFDRVVEATRFLQGRNKLESGARQWAYEIGRLVAAARLSKGDTAFFKRMDIPDYAKLTPDQLIEATGAKFVENAQGNYRSTGLPPYLLSGPQNKGLLALFSIQRWSVERFNNWYKHAWQPAVEEGDFRPFLKSVFAGLVAGSAVETMQELLFNQKPKEMTWKEFMRAENKEVAYTLFSKLQNAGFAGLYGGMLAAGVKSLSGEPPEEVRNLGVDLAGKGITRLIQAGHAMGWRGAGALETLGDFLDAYAKDTIQSYRLIANMRRPDLGVREERMMQRQAGKGGGLNASMAKAFQNPFDPMMDLRQAQSPEEIQKALPRVGRALAANPEYDPRIQSSMRALNERPSYYDFVGQLQGPQAGQAALQRDMGQQQLSLLKKAELARLKWQTQIVGGPP